MLLLWTSLVAMAGQLTFTEEGCKAEPVSGYVSEIALFDTRRSEPTAEELNLAMERAVDSVIEPRCVGLERSACLAMKRQTRVVDYKISESRKQICSLVMVSSSVVRDPTGEVAIRSRFNGDLGRVLAGSAGQTTADQLWMQPTTIMGTGCSAGAIGVQLMNGLNDVLLAQGKTVQVEPKAGLSSIGFRIRVDGAMTAELIYNDGATGAVSSLGQVVVPPEIAPPHVQSCLNAQSLGLDHLRPTSGLKLDVGLRQNIFCEGDVIHPTVHTNVDAKLSVFSLTASGDAYLVWPAVGQDGQISDKLDLGAMVAIPTENREEERLLVVGVAAGESLGLLGSKRSFCKLADWQSLVPSNASVTTMSYQILPAGIGDCSASKLDGVRQR